MFHERLYLLPSAARIFKRLPQVVLGQLQSAPTLKASVTTTFHTFCRNSDCTIVGMVGTGVCMLFFVHFVHFVHVCVCVCVCVCVILCGCLSLCCCCVCVCDLSDCE